MPKKPDLGKIATMAQIEAADPDAAAAIELMKNQLIIVLINRLGGNVNIPSQEIDDSGGFVLSMRIDQHNRRFQFTASKKQ